MHIDPTRTKQVRVNTLLRVHREHHHPLFRATRGYKPVHEVQYPRNAYSRDFLRHKPVQVLDHHHRFRRRMQEEQFQIRITRDFIQVDVEHVVGEEIGHGGDEARFSGAGRTVEEVAPFPDAAEAVVVLFRSKEGFEIGFDLVFEIRFHDDGVERGRMRERNGSPLTKLIGAVGEEAQVALPLLVDFVGYGVNVLKIRTEDSALVHLPDLENVGSVSVWVGMAEPVDCGSEKTVLDGLVGGEAEDDVVLVLPSEEVGKVGVLDGR